MRKNSLIILTGVFIVLIGLVFVKKNLRHENPVSEELADIVKPSVKLEDLDEITLLLGKRAGDAETGGKPNYVNVVKENGQWKITTLYNVLANDQVISQALDKLDQVEGELRSNKKNILGDYGISDEEAFQLKLKRTDGKIVHVLVGAKSAGFQNNFVRLGGSNAVYIVNENLLSAFGVRGEGGEQKLDTERWADKRITHMDVNSVNAIMITEVINSKQETVIDLKQEMADDKKQWQSTIPYDFGLKAAKIKRIAENFNNTYARKVIAPGTPGVFGAPSWVAVFTFENGDEVKLVRGNKDEEENNYYVKQEGADYHFLVPVSTFDNRKKQQGDIFADNPLKIDLTNIHRLTVNDLVKGKKMDATKKEKAASDEPSAEEEQGEKDVKAETIWGTAGGEEITAAKITDIVSKIKAFRVEAVSQPSASLENAMEISFGEDGSLEKYTISNKVTLESGKECQMLKADGRPKGYCLPESQVTALQNILP